jgi:hypothetical protein
MLALDTLFQQCTWRSAAGGLPFIGPMLMALRAQSQCRVTHNNLMALKKRRASKNSRKRTVENRKVPG